MTPEELSDIRTQLKILEARKCPEGDCPLLYPGCGCNRSKMLEHIDQQAAQIKELSAAIVGPIDKISKILEDANAELAVSNVLKGWQKENGKLREQITALKEIAIQERAKHTIHAFAAGIYWSSEKRIEETKIKAKEMARQQLEAEHEAMR